MFEECAQQGANNKAMTKHLFAHYFSRKSRYYSSYYGIWETAAAFYYAAPSLDRRCYETQKHAQCTLEVLVALWTLNHREQTFVSTIFVVVWCVGILGNNHHQHHATRCQAERSIQLLPTGGLGKGQVGIDETTIQFYCAKKMQRKFLSFTYAQAIFPYFHPWHPISTTTVQ